MTDHLLTKGNIIKYGLLLLVMMLIPFLIEDNYILHLLIVSLVWANVVTNWNLTLGYGGMFHIAQPTFLAVGAYVAGISAVQFGISPWICLAIGGIGTLITGILIGVPSLRVKGIYLILLTFALHFTTSEVVFHLKDYTGGSMGLTVPTFHLGAIEFSSVNLAPYYYIALLSLIASLLVAKLLIRSNIGKALIATRDSEVLAVSCGINLYKFKLITFSIAAFMTGIVGAFYSHYIMVIGPELFTFSQIVNGFGMIVVGGIGTFMGPVLGSFAITFLSELFRDIESFRPIIVGAIIILTLIFAPKGILHEFEKLLEKIRSLIVPKPKKEKVSP
jgi:branched-chain amino acid transport system permease protein